MTPRVGSSRARFGGFTPRLDDWGPAGEPRSWLPIERAVHYGYHEAGAAAGRLAYADGPLPGPSDRTGYHYDAVGRLRRVELPEGLSEEYRWDTSGRLINWRDIDGVATQLTYGPNGHPTRIDGASQRNGKIDPLASVGPRDTAYHRSAFMSMPRAVSTH